MNDTIESLGHLAIKCYTYVLQESAPFPPD
jgi:hypothetical protein